MTATEISDAAWVQNPFTWKNNRGWAFTKGAYIRYGIPTPTGNKEKDSDPKGGDRIGFREIEITPDMVGKKIAVFTNIEIKTVNDRLKSGQTWWHNFVLEHGGFSEVWKENKNGVIVVTKESIK